MRTVILIAAIVCVLGLWRTGNVDAASTIGAFILVELARDGANHEA